MPKLSILVALAALIVVTGCGLVPQPTMILMAKPDTGETARCKSLVNEANLPIFNSKNLDNCVRQYQALGFVRAETLAPQTSTPAAKAEVTTAQTEPSTARVRLPRNELAQ